MKVIRMKGVKFNSNEVAIPVSPKILKEIKKTAEHSRKIVIPAISKL